MDTNKKYLETILYLYLDERRDTHCVLHNEIKPEPKGNPEGEAGGISRGIRLYFIVYPDLSYNTGILNYISSIDLPGDQYWKS